jgi:phosphoglycerate dehydrogenase-like enzyme
MALMLSLVRHVPRHARRLQLGNWTRIEGIELQGSNLGLIGMGRIGQEVARRAAAFGMNISYADPVPAPASLEDELGAVRQSLEAVLAKSDIISLHLPLTAETHQIINKDALRLFRPTAYLINAARGGLIDETALHQALSSGSLAGAACDVFVEEPPVGNPLLELDNFIGTPHTGSPTRQTTARIALAASESVLAVLRGERPDNVVNPEVFDR